MPPGHPPKTTKNRPKSLPRRIFSLLNFDFVLGSMFGRFGVRLGVVWDPKMELHTRQNRSKNRSKNGLLKKPLQDRPKIAQDPPKTAQDPPTTPKGSQASDPARKGRVLRPGPRPVIPSSRKMNEFFEFYRPYRR